VALFGLDSSLYFRGMITRRLKVEGRVQGVGFRYHTRLKANDLNIRGTVENQQDGSVLIEACGTEADLNQFIEWCNVGPEMANVQQLTINETSEKSFTHFTILR